MRKLKEPPPELCAFQCGNVHTNIPVRMHFELVDKGNGRILEDCYTTMLICDACWNQEHPDRVPTRVNACEQL